MSILISDFDGTVRRYDFFDRVRKRWPFSPQDDPWEKFVTGEITHFQVLAEIFACIRTTEADLLELADSTELDTSFAKSARVLQDRGWEIVIASAGCDWYIKFLLKKAGVSVSVHANPGTFDPERGLEMSLPERSPFFSPTKGVNKVAIVRMRLVGRITLRLLEMAGRILSLRCWCRLSCVLLEGGWPRLWANAASHSILLSAGHRSRTTCRKPNADPETNRDPGAGARKAGSFGSNGHLRRTACVHAGRSVFQSGSR
jgi:hypothetical protein